MIFGDGGRRKITALVDATGRIVAYGVGDVGGRQVMARALALLRE